MKYRTLKIDCLAAPKPAVTYRDGADNLLLTNRTALRVARDWEGPWQNTNGR